MLSVFDVVLQLFVDGAVGKKTILNKEINPNEVLKLAKEHNIYYSVLEALLLSDINWDESTKNVCANHVKNIQLTSYYRHLKYAELLKVFEDNGIPYALLKGYSVARYYKNPYTRLSGDTDVLINKTDEKKALKILRQYGFELVELSTSEMKHSILNHPELGVMELHIALYNKKTQQLWFEDDGCKWEVDLSFSKLEKIPFDDMYYYTLPADENIMFLFEHIVKHFIYGGTSIRTLLDFYFAYTKDTIDYDLFYANICKKGYKTIFNAVIATVERYLPENTACVPNRENSDPDLIVALLGDMENGKWLGNGNGDNIETIRAFESSKDSSNRNVSKATRILRKVFPEARSIKNNYSYALKHPVLLPVAWFHRLLRFLFNKQKHNPQKVDNHNRTELLKQFDLL